MYLNPSLESVSELISLEYVGGILRVYYNAKLDNIDGMLNALHYVRDYVQIEYQNASIDCPMGTGTLYGKASMMKENLAVNLSYGNWCTINCVHPLELRGNLDQNRPKRMWSTRHQDVWSKSWGPYCA